MKRKTLALLLVLALGVALFAGCSSPATTTAATTVTTAATTTEPAPAKVVTIGYIQAGPDVYYQREVEGVKYVVETKNNQKVIVLNSEYKQEKELSNADDLIAQNVDAIVLMSANADTAQKVAQKCNEAKIPLFLSAWEMTEGPGKADGALKIDMVLSGKLAGEYVAKNFPNTKGYIVTGIAGQGVGDPYTEGFMAAIKDAGITIVDQQAADWDRNKAIKKAQDMLTADQEVAFMFVENEDMAFGVATVLKEMGLEGKIALVSQNGSPTGEEMIAKGQLAATSAWSPTLCGVQIGQLVLDYLAGKTTDTFKIAPITLITKDNLSELAPWDLDMLIKYLGE